MRQNIFFDQVSFDETEREKIEDYLKCRGVSEHIFVCNYLQGFKLDKVAYAEIATAFRYDKRIRRILFKYIGFLEENIRAFIVNRYEYEIVNLSKTKDLQNILDQDPNLYLAISGLTFGKLIKQFKKLSYEEKKSFSQMLNLAIKI